MDGGTTSLSGWGIFWFLAGFTVLATAAIGGGFISLIAGAIILAISVGIFKAARDKEGL